MLGCIENCGNWGYSHVRGRQWLKKQTNK